MWSLWRGLSARVLDLLAPRRCAGCDLPARFDLCDACAPHVISPLADTLHGIPLISVGAYTPPLSVAVKRLKYQGRADVSVPLASLLSRAAAHRTELAASRLVPVPLHPSRLRERGFNQSALLARELATRLKLPVDHNLLHRVRGGPAQAGCRGDARRVNILGAFAAQPAHQALRLTLVDDVVTTGATAAECVRALQAAGHSVAAVLAVCTTGKADRQTPQKTRD